MNNIFGFILSGVLLVIAFALIIVFAIWSFKADKEIEEMEEQLNQMREQEMTEEDILENIRALTKKERKAVIKAPPNNL